jgi:hypothetical protein
MNMLSVVMKLVFRVAIRTMSARFYRRLFEPLDNHLHLETIRPAEGHKDWVKECLMWFDFQKFKILFE